MKTSHVLVAVAVLVLLAALVFGPSLVGATQTVPPRSMPALEVSAYVGAPWDGKWAPVAGTGTTLSLKPDMDAIVQWQIVMVSDVGYPEYTVLTATDTVRIPSYEGIVIKSGDKAMLVKYLPSVVSWYQFAAADQLVKSP